MSKTNKAKRWTSKEEKYLRRNFGSKNIKVLCKRLGRSKAAIYAKHYVMKQKEKNEEKEKWKARRQAEDDAYEADYGHKLEPMDINDYFANTRSMWNADVHNWRIDVFDKDNDCCQICGKQGANLQAHHLNGWNWCKSGRFDVNNGVTLCKDCHMRFHSEFGRRNNTKEQFETFKKQQKNRMGRG